jgi:hypothetical protein
MQRCIRRPRSAVRVARQVSQDGKKGDPTTRNPRKGPAHARPVSLSEKVPAGREGFPSGEKVPPERKGFALTGAFPNTFSPPDQASPPTRGGIPLSWALPRFLASIEAKVGDDGFGRRAERNRASEAGCA